MQEYNQQQSRIKEHIVKLLSRTKGNCRPPNLYSQKQIQPMSNETKPIGSETKVRLCFNWNISAFSLYFLAKKKIYYMKILFCEIVL